MSWIFQWTTVFTITALITEILACTMLHEYLVIRSFVDSHTKVHWKLIIHLNDIEVFWIPCASFNFWLSFYKDMTLIKHFFSRTSMNIVLLTVYFMRLDIFTHCISTKWVIYNSKRKMSWDFQLMISRKFSLLKMVTALHGSWSLWHSSGLSQYWSDAPFYTPF